MKILALLSRGGGGLVSRYGARTGPSSFPRWMSKDAQEIDSDDDFKPKVKEVMSSEDSVQEEIKKIVNETDVVLFMKGLPSAPQCGFSMRTVQILKATGTEYRAFNVLSSDALREGIKHFSKWPTIPQLYVKGDFVGGCDIVEQLYNTGELKQMLQPTEKASDAEKQTQ